jgi:hypothetical protein
MIGQETYMELLRSWPHWAMEITVEFVTWIPVAVLGFITGKKWKKHDATHVHIPPDIGDYECEFCPFVCDTEEEMSDHLVSDHNILEV